MVTQEEIDCRLASAELRGEARGEARGADATRRAMAKAMLAKGISPDVVAECSGLSEDEIQAL